MVSKNYPLPVQNSVHSGSGGPIFKIGGCRVGGVNIPQKEKPYPLTFSRQHSAQLAEVC